MEIVKAQDQDADTVKNLMKASYTPQLMSSYRNLKDTLIAQMDGKAVAFAAFSLNEIHPHSKKIYVGVLPEFRGKGIGACIHAELLKGILEKHPLFVHCYAHEKEAHTFLRKMGYQFCVSDHLIELDLARIPKEPFVSQAKSYFELEQSGFDLQKISDFLIDLYIESHQWNPPCERLDGIWKIARDETDLDLHHSFAIVENDQVIAASDAYANPFAPKHILPLGWSDFDSPTNIEKYKAMLVRQLQKIAQSGYLSSFFDLQSSKSYAQELLEWLPIKHQDLYTIHRLDPAHVHKLVSPEMML